MTDQCTCRFCRAGMLIDKAMKLEGDKSDHAIFLMLFSAGTISTADNISLGEFLRLAAAAYGEGVKVMQAEPDAAGRMH